MKTTTGRRTGKKPLRLYTTETEFVEVGANPLTRELATRITSGDWLGLAGLLPNPDPVLRKSGQSLRTYRDLLSDSHVGGIVFSRKAATLRLSWTIDREGISDQIAADAVSAIFDGLKVRRLVEDILNAPLFGFQPLEVVWTLDGPNGTIAPDKVVAKPANWFGFDTANRLRFLSRGNETTGEEVPDFKFLVAQHNPEYVNPYGESVLSRVFWPVAFKRGTLQFWVRYIEKFGTPYVSFEYPVGYTQDQIDDMVGVIDSLVQDAVIGLPQGANVNLVSGSATGSAELYASFIATANAEISKGILGHTGTSDATPGKLGSEDAAKEVRSDIADSDRELVEDVLNSLIDWIYDLNFPTSTGKRVRFVMYEDSDVDLNIAQRDAVLAGFGVSFTPEYIASTYGFKASDFTLGKADDVGLLGSIGGSTLVKDLQVAYFAGQLTRAAAMANIQTVFGLSVQEAEALFPEQETPTQVPPGQPPVDNVPGNQGPTFAEGDSPADPANFVDQTIVDRLSEGISGATLQDEIGRLVAPLQKIVDGAATYDEALSEVLKAYPDVDSTRLQKTFERLFFVAAVVGRASANDEDQKKPTNSKK